MRFVVWWGCRYQTNCVANNYIMNCYCRDTCIWFILYGLNYKVPTLSLTYILKVDCGMERMCLLLNSNHRNMDWKGRCLHVLWQSKYSKGVQGCTNMIKRSDLIKEEGATSVSLCFMHHVKVSPACCETCKNTSVAENTFLWIQKFHMQHLSRINSPMKNQSACSSAWAEVCCSYSISAV